MNSALASHLEKRGLESWVPILIPALDALKRGALHGDSQAWLDSLNQFPRVQPSQVRLDAPAISIGAAEDLDATQRQQLQASLSGLHPWRKGPFRFFGMPLDSEWRSDWKWERIAPLLGDLGEARILDVGSGNGYYMLRLLGAGAKAVLGVDPGVLSQFQFQALTSCVELPAWNLPVRLEHLPPEGSFDLVLSMGVLSHSRQPLEHLRLLREHLAPGALLILETLVIPGSEGETLRITDRYARMRNLWLLPSSLTLRQWLLQSGFSRAELVSETVTSPQEQRRTPWMRFHSLAEALDPNDSGRTIEGHPAPRRAIFKVRREN